MLVYQRVLYGTLRYLSIDLPRSDLCPGCWPVELPCLCLSWASACGLVKCFGKTVRCCGQTGKCLKFSTPRLAIDNWEEESVYWAAFSGIPTHQHSPIQHPLRGPPPGPLWCTWSPPLGFILRPLLQPKWFRKHISPLTPKLQQKSGSYRYQ